MPVNSKFWKRINKSNVSKHLGVHFLRAANKTTRKKKTWHKQTKLKARQGNARQSKPSQTYNTDTKHTLDRTPRSIMKRHIQVGCGLWNWGRVWSSGVWSLARSWVWVWGWGCCVFEVGIGEQTGQYAIEASYTSLCVFDERRVGWESDLWWRGWVSNAY